ncbi:MAG: cyclic pyranopterin monophosphate synthase MoaC [Planctomycetes bacterium]|nr:cyclic pyranopterin monophosphate synthase MoaC [Planctomycetota bacterium]
MPKAKLSHIDSAGAAKMVDVAGKGETQRAAVAEAMVNVGPKIAKLIARGGLAKGDVLSTARLAGIAAAKRTAELIPLCHNICIEHADVRAELVGGQVRIIASARATAKTGVEMEALTAAAVAALTVYDMVKSAGKGVQIGPIRLLEKTGGKSGSWRLSDRRPGRGTR